MMFYKQSVKSTTTGMEFEVGQYKGSFRNGKRDGFGKMIWGDGSCFEGQWKNDMRSNGTMIMAQTNWTYKGNFVEDKFHDRNGMLMLPNMVIY